MENKVIVNFENIISELRNKGLKLCFLKNVYGKTRGLFIEDSQKNLYQMEIYRQGSYLDKLIKEGIVVEFYRVEDLLSKNLNDCEKEIWSDLEVEAFIERQYL